MTRAQLITEIASLITDALNKQNTAARVREALALLVTNCANVEEDGTGGSDFDPESIPTYLRFTSDKWIGKRLIGTSGATSTVAIAFSDAAVYMVIGDNNNYSGIMVKPDGTINLRCVNGGNSGTVNELNIYSGEATFDKVVGYNPTLPLPSLSLDGHLVHLKKLNDSLALKLDASEYNDRYKGKFVTLAALQSAYPNPTAGWYAIVDSDGVTGDAKEYIVDTITGGTQWVLSSGTPITSTDSVAEGSTNLYFTAARAISALTSTLSNYLLSSNNLSDLSSAKTARVNIGLDKRTVFGNSDYSALITDREIVTSVAFTAPRRVTLIGGLNAGAEVIVADEFQTVTSTNTLTIAVPSGKKLNGVTNGTETIRGAGGWRRFFCDGSDNYIFDAGVARLSGATFTGNITAPNLSGTNTGDQVVRHPLLMTLDSSNAASTINTNYHFGMYSDLMNVTAAQHSVYFPIAGTIESISFQIYCGNNGVVTTNSYKAYLRINNADVNDILISDTLNLQSASPVRVNKTTGLGQSVANTDYCCVKITTPGSGTLAQGIRMYVIVSIKPS